MKYLKKINEMFKTPLLNNAEIIKMVKYIEEFAKKNNYDIYQPKDLDITNSYPQEFFNVSEPSENDPYGEEIWNEDRLISSMIHVFESDDDRAPKILTFFWNTYGEKCTNTLVIDNSEFTNIDLNFLKLIL